MFGLNMPKLYFDALNAWGALLITRQHYMSGYLLIIQSLPGDIPNSEYLFIPTDYYPMKITS